MTIKKQMIKLCYKKYFIDFYLFINILRLLQRLNCFTNFIITTNDYKHENILTA